MVFWSLFSFSILVHLVEVKSASGDSVKNNYFRMCRLSSPDFGSCIGTSIMEAKPKFINGIPEIGFPTVEPLYFTPFDFKENNRHFKINAKFTEFSMAGLSNMTIENVKASGDINTEMTINLTTTSPVFRTRFNWVGKGRAFHFTVNGKGKIDVNLTKTDFKLSIRGSAKVNEKDGKKYFSVHSVALDPIMRKVRVYVSDLFPHDLNLNKMANKFLNRNINFIMRIVRHYPAKYIGAEVEKLVKIVFDTWPIDELMLE